MGILFSFYRRHKVLSWIFIICSIHSLVYKLYLVRIQEPYWFSYASELGEVIYDLTIGTIASVIFFFVVVFINDYKKRLAVASIVQYHLLFVIEEGIGIFSKLNMYSPTNFPPTLEDVKKQCESHDPMSEWISLGNGKALKWKDALTFWYNSINGHTKEIWKHVEYFQNDKLVRLLVELDNAVLFDTHTRPFARMIRNLGAPISDWTKDLHEFFLIINGLLEIYDEEFKDDIKYSKWYKIINEKIIRSKS